MRPRSSMMSDSSDDDLILPSHEELAKAVEADQDKSEKNEEKESTNTESEKESVVSPKKVQRSGQLMEGKETRKELKYRTENFNDISDVITSRKLRCTACCSSLQAVVADGRDVFFHPVLKVLFCKSCVEFYGDGNFSVDEDGSDKYCRWCGQGGTLYCCATCSCAFCKACIKRNLNRTILVDIEEDDWQCFVCNTEPLWELRAICVQAMKYSKMIRKKKREQNERSLKKLQKKGSKRETNRWQKRESSHDSSEDDSEPVRKKSSKSKKLTSKRKRDQAHSSSDGDKPEKKKQREETGSEVNKPEGKQLIEERYDSDVAVVLSEKECITLTDSDDAIKKSEKKKSKESSAYKEKEIPDKVDEEGKKEVAEIFEEHLTDLVQTGQLIAFRAQRLIDKKVKDTKNLEEMKSVDKVVESMRLLVKLAGENMQHTLDYLSSQHKNWQKHVVKRHRARCKKERDSTTQKKDEAVVVMVNGVHDSEETESEVKISDEKDGNSEKKNDLEIKNAESDCRTILDLAGEGLSENNAATEDEVPTRELRKRKGKEASENAEEDEAETLQEKKRKLRLSSKKNEKNTELSDKENIFGNDSDASRKDEIENNVDVEVNTKKVNGMIEGSDEEDVNCDKEVLNTSQKSIDSLSTVIRMVHSPDMFSEENMDEIETEKKDSKTTESKKQVVNSEKDEISDSDSVNTIECFFTQDADPLADDSKKGDDDPLAVNECDDNSEKKAEDMDGSMLEILLKDMGEKNVDNIVREDEDDRNSDIGKLELTPDGSDAETEVTNFPDAKDNGNDAETVKAKLPDGNDSGDDAETEETNFPDANDNGSDTGTEKAKLPDGNGSGDDAETEETNFPDAKSNDEGMETEEDCLDAQQALLAYSSDDEDEDEHKPKKKERKKKDRLKKSNTEKDESSDKNLEKSPRKKRPGPKSKTSVDFDSTSSSTLSSSSCDDDTDSSGKQQVKAEVGKKKKLKLKDTEAYREDKKLGEKCAVKLTRLSKEQFDELYENYYSTDEGDSDTTLKEAKEIKSLVNLKSLKKGRGRKSRKNSDESEEGSEDDSSQDGKKKLRTKKDKKKEQEQRLIDFFNEEADDDLAATDDDTGSGEDSRSASDMRKHLKKSIPEVENEAAMNILLQSSSSDNEDLSEEEDEPKKEKKKRKKNQKEEEVKDDSEMDADKENSLLLGSDKEEEQEKEEMESNKMDVDKENSLLFGSDNEEEQEKEEMDVDKENSLLADSDKEEEKEETAEAKGDEDETEKEETAEAKSDVDGKENEETAEAKSDEDETEKEETAEVKNREDENEDEKEENEKGTEADENEEGIDGTKENEEGSEIKVEKDEENASKEKENKEKKDDDSSDDSPKTKNWRRDKLLTEKLSDLDTSDEERLWKIKREKEKKVEDIKKKVRRRILGSDDDEDDEIKVPSSSSESESKSSGSDSDICIIKKKKKKASKSSDSDSDSDFQTKKPKRRRIKAPASDSSSNDDDDDGDPSSQKSTPGKGRKKIHHIMSDDNVAEATRRAAKEEEERKRRIAEKQKMYNEIFKVVEGVEKLDKLVLDFDPETKKELVSVDSKLVPKLKPHQAKGVKFMWDACFESLKHIKKTKGSGCILAHCMGLGKTFQIVTLVHTLLNHKATGVQTVLVVCPLSTVLNWVSEFNMWLKGGEEVNVFELTRYKQNYERAYQLKDWQESGGVMVMGYEMYRNLTNTQTKRLRKKAIETFQSTLVDPGPDLVVCDEGHLLKNEDSAIAKAMRRIRTLRRIVLTGTPLQNNLKEYHCMVQFVKPNLLGNRKEFLNRFVNPITNGQFEDSTLHDVKVMKRRAHVLHKMLEGSVQRFDYSVLTPFLPPKHEYVISIRLSEMQVKAYRHYLEVYSRLNETNKGAQLFSDYQNLLRIWTHPRVLLMSSERAEKVAEKKRWMESDSEGSLKDFIDDGSDSKSDTSSDESSDEDDSDVQVVDGEKEKEASKKNKFTRSTRSKGLPEEEEKKEEEEKEKESANEWWRQFIQGDELENINYSGKLVLLFSILRECEKIGDKVLVFSQSLFSLDLIEYFLSCIDSATQNGETKEEVGNHTGSWSPGLDYFRLDGSTSTENRNMWCKTFNREDNHRARLFIISTRAGGLGINLFAANRVIIFDASWNPSHDVQSIFRVYRFGQKKPCYIYRFLAQGTMEEKIYDRQVTKLSLSCRVVDEQQIERHYNMADLQELYRFDPEQKTKRPTPILPKDRLLAELLKEHEQWIVTYHEHDSLLENKEEEELNEEERKAAWEEYENEKQGKVQMQTLPTPGSGLNLAALREALRKENPTATEEQLEQKMNMVISQFFEYVTSHQNQSANPQVKYTAAQLQALQQYQLQQEQIRAQQRLLKLQHESSLMKTGFNPGTNVSFQQYLQNKKQVNSGPYPKMGNTSYPTNLYRNTSDKPAIFRTQPKLVPINPNALGAPRMIMKAFNQNQGADQLLGRVPMGLPSTYPKPTLASTSGYHKMDASAKKQVPDNEIETIE